MPIDPDFWASRRVLVTGHTGFKGAWLSLWLRSMGASVSGIAPGSPTDPSLYAVASTGSGVSEHAVDVRDAPALIEVFAQERPEIVLHLAAQPMVRRSLRDPHGTYEINIMGTVNVLEAVRGCPDVRAVLVVTSDKCYDNSDDVAHDGSFTEGDAMGGSDPYSSSKGCAELVSGAYRASYFSGHGGPRLATARAGNVIGGGDWGEDRLIPDMVRAAAVQRPIRIRNPEAVRPWQHVLNPLYGYLTLAQSLWDSPEFAEAWNFGPDPEDARPVRWIVQRLLTLWGGALEWEHDQDQNPPEARNLTLDSSKAAARLGWRPVWDLEQALERIVHWHQSHRRGDDMRSFSLAQIDEFMQHRLPYRSAVEPTPDPAAWVAHHDSPPEDCLA
ncbi:MAG TPA: CDP-glucose 4,6-dehydratase [Solirubrobacteraceae bacterium]